MATQIITTPKPITEEQKKQYLKFIEDATKKGTDLALKQIPLNEDGFKKLIKNGKELDSAIATVILAKTRELSSNNLFAEEEKESKYGYLSGYKSPKHITEQMSILQQLFPFIGHADEEITKQPFPQDTEGWFAIPRWQKVGSTYENACQNVFDIIKKARSGKFSNYIGGQLDSRSFRRSEKTNMMFNALAEQQDHNDILIIPAQFGFAHRGRSVCRAREIMPDYEFGLGVFEVAIMLLTHHKRLRRCDDLWIHCGGDEFSYNSKEFESVPCFCFGDEIEFKPIGIHQAHGYYGCASACIF